MKPLKNGIFTENQILSILTTVSPVFEGHSFKRVDSLTKVFDDYQNKIKSKNRPQHTQQYTTESLALSLSEKVGVRTAAKQLGLHESQLYSGRSKARLSHVSGKI